MSRSLETTLEAVYNCEINVGIQSMWDGGYDVWLGYGLESDRSNAVTVRSADKLADAIHDLVMVHYPTSGYAKAIRPSTPS